MRYLIRFYIVCFAFISILSLPTYAQLNESAAKSLVQKEDTLQLLSQKMVFDEHANIRFRSDSLFVKTFIRALQIPFSFHYNFDSLNISKLYAPDSSFKIFTWQLKKDEYVYLQKGAIQMRTKDGSLKLYPLFDNSMFTKNILDSARNRFNWVGAIYYKIIQTKHQGKSYYTLLGFDDFTVNMNKKWIETLHFDINGEPVFGGNMFSFKNDSIKKPTQSRYCLEYKKEAKAYLNFDKDLNMIIVDHLISETDEPDKKFTYVPDGDYEGFKWDNGQWVHIDKVFNFKLKDGEFPMEAILMDDSGKKDESKIKQQENKKPTPPKKK